MSTKSKRRYARRHASDVGPTSRRHPNGAGAQASSHDDREIVGELMGAILAAFSFGALASES